MNKMLKKLKQKKGETLVESMFSMLIALLAMALLCTCVMAATNVNAGNREADKRFSEQLKKAETMTEPNAEECRDATNTLKLSFQQNGVELESKTVGNQSAITEDDYSLIYYAGEEDDSFISYEYIP